MNRFTYLVKPKYHSQIQKSMVITKKIRVHECFWRVAQAVALKVVHFVSVKWSEIVDIFHEIYLHFTVCRV